MVEDRVVERLEARVEERALRQYVSRDRLTVGVIGFQDRCRCAVAAAHIAESLGPFGIITGEQLFDPSFAKRRRLRYLRDGVTTRQ